MHKRTQLQRRGQWMQFRVFTGQEMPRVDNNHQNPAESQGAIPLAEPLKESITRHHLDFGFLVY